MNNNINGDMLQRLSQFPIYELDDIIDKRVNIKVIYSIFYVLTGMQAILGRKEFDFYYSCENLRKDIEDYLNYITDIFSKMLYEYTVLVTFGELRYAGDKINQRVVYVKNLLPQRLKINPDYLYKRSYYKSYLTIATNFSPESICQTGMLLFNNFCWEREYGGKNWGIIADIIQKYRQYPAHVFIDYCSDIEHNSGNYLNKDCGLFKGSTDNLRCILDIKRNSSIFALIDYVRCNLDAKTVKLIIRFINVIHFLLGQVGVILPSDFLVANDLLEFADNDEYNYTKNSCLRSIEISKEYLTTNNMEVFKLSLYKPRVFGAEDLRRYFGLSFDLGEYKEIYRNYESGCLYKRHIEEIPHPRTMKIFCNKPLSQIKFLKIPDWYEDKPIIQAI